MSLIAYSGYQNKTSISMNSATSAIGNVQEGIEQIATNPILNIHVSAENLIKLDVGSPSDPICVLFIKKGQKFVEFARTEIIWNDPNPKWVKFFQTLYIFETQQPLRFEVYDADSEKSSLKEHDLIGYTETDVQNLVSHVSEPIRFELKHPTKNNQRGTLIISSEQAKQSSTILRGELSFTKLKNIHTFSKNCPYFTVSRPSESGNDIPAYRSEVISKAVSGRWGAFSIPLQNLCGDDYQSPITISVYHYNKRKAGELIGSVTNSLLYLLEHPSTPMEIKNKGKKMGTITLIRIQTSIKPTFLDYLRSGLQLNLITSIDFTASNRNPNLSNSLHYLQQGVLNSYETCIWNVGNIICPYDTDQLFPVYGFGANVNGRTSHCFPLTFDPQNPTVHGLQGILDAYRNSLVRVQLSGPTLFAPIITAAMEVARDSYASSKTYTVLLIITDGVINDEQETIDAIVNASDEPLSIIIIGVGGANFSAMEKLDADDNPLRSRDGRKMKRDIVQFVPFRNFDGDGVGLASAVLAEIPTQVDQFCQTHGFIPQM